MLLEHSFELSPFTRGKEVEVSNLCRIGPDYSEENTCHYFLNENIPSRELALSIKFYLIEVIEIISQ